MSRKITELTDAVENDGYILVIPNDNGESAMVGDFEVETELVSEFLVMLAVTASDSHGVDYSIEPESTLIKEINSGVINDVRTCHFRRMTMN